ncbi:MAG: T9SS type A sorting domain-containing protein [Bacteroidetes bacterium]|nr:T9SS type A sorting domain-containing protein [Bacteroidota bacterium]
MNPGSKIMFGENSGIVCDSGTKLIANDAAFTSVDSAKKWNGIFLKHRSQDTIKNCLISNAQYGINIFGKNDDEGTEVPFSTEISGCSFVNKSGSELSIAVYAANSSNLLIMNNTVSSANIIKGFAQGIYTEFCSGGNVNFIGNTISGTGNGMTMINSSPFVSQNVINGNQYSESGIFLDNSNGKFKYNTINDFYYSFYSLLSSPDLLKNIFGNSYAENIYLTYSSAPNLKPVSSGGNTYWLSGDNLIKGEPSNAGIFFEDESLPNIGFGYNRFIMSNNDYYISGTVPSSYDSYFDMRENYWGTIPPDTGKFDIANSIGILYDPYDDNSSEARAVNNYILYDIGFGLKDTVFYLEGDNPGMANELYLEAYQKENSGEFSEAIEIYKEIISDFKDSVYAVSSLSGLFNCYEKKNSTQTEFSVLQNYYSDIFEDTAYSETQRNLSEDLMIKSKVKQNNIEGAVSDYNTIYTNNLNTAKGTHALINMEILSAGAGDNLSGSNEIANLEMKQNRINDILSSVINKKSDNLLVMNKQPERFHLSQNFPNPFHPKSIISYQLSNTNYVKLKVFNVLGKEVMTLVNEKQPAGNYSVEFNGSGLSSGVYYYRIDINDEQKGSNYEIKNMILIK